MTKRKATGRTVIAWQPAVLRLTAFTQSPYEGSEDWWKMIVGTPAETVFTQAKAQERREEGAFLRGKLTLDINPIRIEWRYSVVEEISQQGPQFNTLGAFPENHDRFRHLMVNWLSTPSVPPITRLAFGAVLLQPTETLEKGYEILAPYLPFLNLKNVSDLLYQINRARESQIGIADLKINRLSKWAVLRLQAVVSSPAALDQARRIGEVYASHLEVDINTSANYKQALPSDQLPALFGELDDWGMEIAETGDVE